MTKFHKLQKISSVIPVYSSFIVFIITMMVLKRHKAPIKAWIQFTAVVFVSCIAVYLSNTLLVVGQNAVLRALVSGLILAPTNVLCVDLQIKYADWETTRAEPRIGILLGIIIMGSILLSIIAWVKILFVPSVSIEDTNGTSNTNLAVITMSEILSAADEYSARGISYSSSGAQTNVSGKLEDVDYDQCSFNCKNISGVKTLQASKVNCERMSLEIQSTLTSGNLEIIIVVDGEYYGHVKLNQTDSIVLENIAGKTILVKMAAESARVEITVSRSMT